MTKSLSKIAIEQSFRRWDRLNPPAFWFMAALMSLAVGVALTAQTPTIVLRGTMTYTEWWPTAFNDTFGYLLWDYDGSAPGAVLHTGTNTVTATADFADGSTEYLQKHFKLPSDWAAPVDLSVYWFTTATSGNVVWQFQTVCVADNETDDPSWNTASLITDAAKGTASRLNLASLSALTITGCAAGEMLHLRVLRDPTHAGDTLGATASLLGVEFKYRRSLS